MKRTRKKLIFMVIDAAAAVFSLGAAFYLRYAGHIPAASYDILLKQCIIAAASFLVFSFFFGTYDSLLDYMGFSDAFLELGAVGASAVVFLILRFFDLLGVSGSITVIYAVLLFLSVCSVRILPRFRRWCESRYAVHTGRTKRVVIVGAGDTGSMLVKHLREDTEDGSYPVAMVDDDTAKVGMKLEGVSVRGTVDELERVVKACNADEIIIAIPSASAQLITRVNAQAVRCGKSVRIFHAAQDVGNFLVGDKRALREVSIEDLLFRDAIEPDMTPVERYFANKVVMVTGGCGSIGSEICRQVLRYNCRKLIVFDINENGLFYLNEELKQDFDASRYVLCVGSIRDKARMAAIMRRHHPDVVLHAAAHKHVPMMEINPFEAVKNNIAGTKNLLECCVEEGVSKFLQISTDKAVNPTNIMGATKRVTELLVHRMNGMNGCEMVAVRFGNVLGSNGSVIPTFRRQIKEGGPVTVTHPDITRYFMTIREAVSLVLLAQTLAKGGELFVLDMGKPIKILDLAKDMIELSGYTVGRDIKIQFTGLRPGEKLYEELYLNTEEVDKTSQEKVFIMHSHNYDGDYIKEQVERILAIADEGADEAALRREIFAFIESENLERHIQNKASAESVLVNA